MTRYRSGVACVIAAAGLLSFSCKGDGASATGLSASETASTSTTTTPTTSTASASTSASTTGTTTGTPKLDVGLDDTGGTGGGPPGFPETCEDAADGNTSVGCTFYPLNVPGGAGDLAAFLASNVSDMPANVSLSNSAGVIEAVTIQPGEIYSFEHDAQPLPRDTALLDYGYVLESDWPLQVFQFIPAQIGFTNDATLVLPGEALGQKHRVVSYNDQYNAPAKQYLAVVATEDDTDVTITLAQDASLTLAGGPIPALDKDNGPASTVINMARLEAAILIAPHQNPTTLEFDNELTGTLVESSKPIAVYSGSPGTYLPSCGSNCCCADLITTAVPPTTTYGTRYAGVKLLPLGIEEDGWRFIGNKDGTVVTTSGGVNQMIALDAGDFADVFTAEVFEIESNLPVGVTHFMVSGSSTSIPMPGLMPHDCAFPLERPGDPAVTWVYATDNWLHRYVFPVGIASDGDWCHDHITVVSNMASWDQITLDGASLPAATQVGNSELGYAYVPVDEGDYELLAPPTVGVEVSVYGYISHGSYLYPGGLGLLTLNPEG